MLNKVKIGMLIGFALSVVKFLLPEVDFPEGLQEAVVLIAVFAVQFFVKESKASVAALSLK